jgi:2-polyprenyl-6-methoxyphenol hydroxylase-like FAD-dependent oxidoreductase/predicted DsbA family dithiol-disulfide isomerase
MVKLVYYTDPICSSCWLAEPFLNKLLIEYGDDLDIEVRMGGLLESWEYYQPSNSAVSKEIYLSEMWTSLGRKYGVIMDGKIWTDYPIQSSFPACIAYYAAKKQGNKKALHFLHTLREMVFLQHKDISNEHHVISAAIQCKLDLGQFVTDFKSGIAELDFKRDLNERDVWKITSYPSMVFFNDTFQHRKYVKHINNTNRGEEIYKDWEAIIFELSDGKIKKKKAEINAVEILENFYGMTTTELNSINEEGIEKVNADLEASFYKGDVIKEENTEVNYWSINNSPYKINKNGFKFKTAAIIGGGVCGYFLALHLKRYKIDFKIYEKNNVLKSGGLGFLLLENGLEAMRLLGLKNILLKNSNTLNFFKAINPNGQLIFTQILEECTAISRENFLKILQDEVGDENIFMENQVTNINFNTENKIESVSLQNGEKIKNDIYFACDGIHSKIRTQIFPESNLEEINEREIVGILNKHDLNIPSDEFLKIIDKENGKNMGLIPIGGGEYIWFIQFNNATHPLNERDPESIKKYALDTVKNYPKEFQNVVQYSDPSKSILWIAKRMDLLPSFHTSNLVLAGDAAHPLIAFTSQGANSALEDVSCLLSLLSMQDEHQDVEEIFDLFYQSRKDQINYYIKEGDELVKDFFNLSNSEELKLPISLH